MVLSKIVRANGQVLDSADIVSCEYSASVNQGTNLTVGNMIASRLAAVIRGTGDPIRQGEVLQYWQIEDGMEKKIGVFIAEKPTVVNRACYEVRAYDNICKTEVLFSGWLKEHAGDFPVSVETLLLAACELSGVGIAGFEYAPRDMLVNKFYGDKVTCRQIIAWAAALDGKNVRADPDGALEFCWYTQRDDLVVAAQEQDVTTVQYFRDGLSYENYETEPIDSVQIALNYSDVPVGYPAEGGSNCFTLSGNGLADFLSLEDLATVAQGLYERLNGVSYVPASVSLVRTGAIQAGDILRIVDVDGKAFFTWVMNFEMTPRGVWIEGTGDRERSSAAAVAVSRYTSPGTVDDPQGTLDKVSQEEIFNKLTNNGQAKGVYLLDGEIYINASYLASGTIVADLIKAGILQSADGKTFKLDLDNGTFTMEGSGKFLSEDGQTCIEVLGNELVLYSKDTDGQFIEKVHIGFTRGLNPAGTGLIDYPYIIFGSSETASVGLIKKFYDGIFFGNSVLKDAVGKFSGAEGVAGFFVSTAENKAYVVAGTEMQNVYTGEAVARFA